MKKTIFAIAAVLLSATTVHANALDEKVIAIIDTEIDSSKFSNIIHEVCTVSDKSCSNKTNFQEGPGAAHATSQDRTGPAARDRVGPGSKWRARQEAADHASHFAAIQLLVGPTIQVG